MDSCALLSPFMLVCSFSSPPPSTTTKRIWSETYNNCNFQPRERRTFTFFTPSRQPTIIIKEQCSHRFRHLSSVDNNNNA